jgi:hypoxanthine phosphoribosyltransferase
MKAQTFHKKSWEDLHRDCLALASRVKGASFDRIVSISQGGMVPARILADALSCRVSHITMRSYEDLQQVKQPVIEEHMVADVAGQTVLLVDEIADTGRTFEVAIAHLRQKGVQKILTAAPYIKSHSRFIPDFWVNKVEGWIIFPYELRETFEAFVKMWGTPEKARAKMREVGFAAWEIEALL